MTPKPSKLTSELYHARSLAILSWYIRARPTTPPESSIRSANSRTFCFRRASDSMSTVALGDSFFPLQGNLGTRYPISISHARASRRSLRTPINLATHRKGRLWFSTVTRSCGGISILRTQNGPAASTRRQRLRAAEQVIGGGVSDLFGNSFRSQITVV